MEKNRCLCMKDLPFFERMSQEVFSTMCRKVAAKKYYRRTVFNSLHLGSLKMGADMNVRAHFSRDVVAWVVLIA